MADVLGSFEQAVLLAVIRLRTEAYGSAVVTELCKRLEREITVGAVHATLVRLENKGLLSSHLGEGTPIRAGRPRRYYKVEPKGARALGEARKAFSEIWRGIRLPIKATT
jgi:PadR family transcriptional regulator, regulatory protein PadR